MENNTLLDNGKQVQKTSKKIRISFIIAIMVSLVLLIIPQTRIVSFVFACITSVLFTVVYGINFNSKIFKINKKFAFVYLAYALAFAGLVVLCWGVCLTNQHTVGQLTVVLVKNWVVVAFPVFVVFKFIADAFVAFDIGVIF